MSLIKVKPYIIDSTLDFTFNNVTATGNIVSLNANLGNAAAANYFIGNGSLLTGLPASYTNTNVAAYLPTYTGNLTAGNAALGNLVSANYFTGTLTTSAQPNITSVGTLTNLDITGNLVVGGNLTVNGTVTSINSTIVEIDDLALVLANDASTSSQANGAGIIINGAAANMLYINATNSFTFSHKISADGSLLSSLTGANVTGTVGNATHATVADSANAVAGANVSGTVANATYAITSGTANAVTGSNVSGQVANSLIAGTVYTNAQPNITSVGTLGNLVVTSNVSAGNILTDHLLYSNGVAWSLGGGSASVATLTDVVLTSPADGDVLSYDSANSKWINSVVTGGSGGTGSASSQYVTRTYTGDAANVAFTVSSGASTNSVIVTLSGIVQTPTTDYSVTGTTLTFTTAPPNGVAIQIREIGIPMSSGSNSQLLFNDAGAIGGTANLTFNKTTGMLTAAKLTTTSANLGDAANLRLTGGNVGDLLATVGNGVLAWANVAANGNVIINSTGGSSVTVSSTAPSSPAEGDMWLNSTTGVVNIYFNAAWTPVSSSQLDIQVNTFTGNGVQVDYTLGTEPSGTGYTLVTVGGVVQPRSYYSVTGNVLSFSTAPPNNATIEITAFGGNASAVGIATTVTQNAQPNITSVGTLTSLTSSGNITAPYFIGNGSALTGITSSSAGTVTTNAQPNITSVGTLTSLTVTGNIVGANVTGNHYGNGATLSSITGANVTGFVANANVANTAFAVSASNIVGTVNLANYATVANSVAAANITGTIATATTAGTVTTADQPNITSTGTLTSLTVSGNATFSSWTTFQQSNEVINTKTGATGVVAHDMATGATFYHTSPAANFTANFTNVSTTDSRAIVSALVIIQGATPYVPTAVQIDGAAQTIKWMSSAAPTGTASKTDVVSFTLMRVSGTWSVYGQYSSYG